MTVTQEQRSLFTLVRQAVGWLLTFRSLTVPVFNMGIFCLITQSLHFSGQKNWEFFI